MATVYDQPRREYLRMKWDHFEADLEDIRTTSKKLGLSPADVIAALHVAELKRANDLSVRNGDAWDEQIGGIAECLNKLSDAIESLKDSE